MGEPFQFFHSTPNGELSNISYRNFFNETQDVSHNGHDKITGIAAEHKNVEAKPQTFNDFDLSMLPDNDNDDFSWLVKVLPGADQTVPSEPTDSVQQVPLANEVTQCQSQTTSMLQNSYFSEMDVSQILFPSDSQMQLDGNGHTETVHEAERIELPLRRNRRRSALKDTCQLEQDTPVSLRRSTRKKRSCMEMIEAEAASCQPPVKAVRNSNKRRRIQSGRRSASKSQLSVTEIPTESLNSSDVTQTKPKSPKVSEKRGKSELTIVFKKYVPVNPVGKKLPGYVKGLLDPSKVIAGELYLAQNVPSTSHPEFTEPLGIDTSLVAYNFLKPEKIKVLMKKEWMANQNVIANAKAHGADNLASRTLTDDGKAVRGAFHTMDLDKEYDNLLQLQNNCETVLKWRELFSKGPSAEISTTHHISFNLDKTFSNFSNFTSYFHETLPHELGQPDKTQGLVGVVPVNPFADLTAGDEATNSWSIFSFKGNLYRPNPVAVTIQKTPDQVLEHIKAKPQRISAQAPYYKALTTYFDKNPRLN